MGKWRRENAAPPQAAPMSAPAPETAEVAPAVEQRWLITYEYRQHFRTACMMTENVDVGRRSEVIDCDPATWFAARAVEWQALQDQKDMPGIAMSDIVVTLAVPSK